MNDRLAAAGGTGLIGRMDIDRVRAAGYHPVVPARPTGVRRHITLSIVGFDRVGTGYYAGKLRQEEAITSGDVPWTILRSTQFHEFAGLLLDLLPGRVAVVPKQLSGPATGRAPEISGPEEWRMADLVQRLARVLGRRRAVLELPGLGAAAGAAARGALLPAGSGPRGTGTFDQWLDRTSGRPQPSPVRATS